MNSLEIGLALQFVYLVTWTSSLFMLFAKFKASDRLMPNKKTFLIHGVLLGFYLLCNLILEFELHTAKPR